MSLTIPTLADLRAAAERLRGAAHRTPVLTCASLDAFSGARLFFKCENLQKGGAFKFRGAWNAVSVLTSDQARRGVMTHSSGNHAAALALAARLRGIPAHIVMPRNAPASKQQAVAAYGGRVVLCEPGLIAREETAARLGRETGAVMIHPYDHFHVIAGQGTVALELLEQQPGLSAVVAPVSGGGLLSGIALAIAELSEGVEVFGAEPERADDAAQSFRAGRLLRPQAGATIADGLRANLCERTFAILHARARGILTVGEQEIVQAMRLIWERLKLVVEASAAVPLAAVLKHRATFEGRRVGVVLSGGNLDLEKLPWQK